MDIVIGEYYANDHTNADGVTETNVIHVLSTRNHLDTEGHEPFFATETMFVVDGVYDSLFKLDWLGSFLKRKATEEEITHFAHRRGIKPTLKHWAEEITGLWIE